MRRFLLVVLTTVTGLGVPLGGLAQLVPGAPPTDWSEAQKEYRLATLREYNTLITAWQAALNAGNATTAAAAYGDSALVLVSGHGLVAGRDSIASFLHAFAQELQEIRLGVNDFLASDRLAYASGPMIVTTQAAAGSGTGRALRGQHVTVLVREGKRWRIRSQVLQYELPRPGEE